MNPGLMEMLAQARMAELRRPAATLLFRASGLADGITAEAGTSVVTTGIPRPAAARRTIGWFLVHVGLHLALPRPRAASVR